MAKLKIQGKELRAIGYPEGPVISVAMNVMEKNYKHHNKEEAMEILKAVLASPATYLDNAVLGLIAKQLMPPPPVEGQEISLNNNGIQFNVFGSEHIEEGAMHQMYQAAKLPVSVAGALMPDAHSGYGLPIGGVLATENAVIPYGVGVDIGCRMCLSIYDIDPKELVQREHYFTREINEATLFGSGRQFDQASDHEVMESNLFYELPLLKGLHGRAWKQLGSSGSGNHFVEFGIFTLHSDLTQPLNRPSATFPPSGGEGQEGASQHLPAGQYVALLSHSGSRGTGAAVCDHYSKLAFGLRRAELPSELLRLAWLSLDSQEGQEYWNAMELMGHYAAANHACIHRHIAENLGAEVLLDLENHHNFAWKEKQVVDGVEREVIVHRKGATRALPPGHADLPEPMRQVGQPVLVPGSMGTASYVLTGIADGKAFHSACHGAGRLMSRHADLRETKAPALRTELATAGIHVRGSSNRGLVEEAPRAYKDVAEVVRVCEAARLAAPVTRLVPVGVVKG